MTTSSVVFSSAETKAEAFQKIESLSPVVNDFKLLIEGDPKLYMLFNEMFEQANKASLAPGYPSSAKQIKDYHQMLLFLDGYQSFHLNMCFRF